MERPIIKAIMLGPSLQQQGGMATVENLILQYPPAGVEIRHISTHEEGSSLHRAKVFTRGLWQYLRILLSERVDLIHIHMAERGSVARKGVFSAIAFLFRVPLLIHTHGAEFESFFYHLPRLSRWAIATFFQRCDGFLVLSKTWEKFYIEALGLNPRKMFVLPNPIEIPPHLPDRSSADRVRFFFAGRVGQRKGAFDLIQAFAHLSEPKKSRVRLTIAGDGEIEKASTLVRELALTEIVSFAGWIGVAERERLLRQSDVFVLPSYNEGLPMAILEAMSWGLPIISTPVGGIPEVVIPDRHGFLVTPGDIEGLTAAIERAIDDEPLRLSLGDNARQSAVAFDVLQYSIRLGDLYRSILARSS
jgi:glycosyltransferase involved in cell wall biosynthesis